MTCSCDLQQATENFRLRLVVDIGGVKTLAERVFDILREKLVSGQLPTGTKLRQETLAIELGVSKIPLREALARLEQEGLIAGHANRGYIVPPMSAAQLCEIFALRLSLEPVAAANASKIADEASRAKAIAAFNKLYQGTGTGTGTGLATVRMHHRQFRMTLIHQSGHALTNRIIEQLLVLSERYAVAHLAPAECDLHRHHEYKELLDRWLARDSSGLKKILVRQISTTLKDLLKNMS